ncbi:MAG: hypothetical protein JJU00_04500 [Opitutales bacterium]|nr:hypothetical protein [Opitutales bacterium]
MAKRIATKRIAEALRANGGLIAPAADALRCARSTIHRRIAEKSALAEILEDAREETLDLAESALLRKIEEGDTASIIFFLKTRGRGRGYGATPEIAVHTETHVAAPAVDEARIREIVRQARESALRERGERP